MIRMNNVSLRLGQFSLTDFSLEVRGGEYYILLGPSGVGKSVILETIAGFHHVEKGTIEIDGFDVTRLPSELRGLGYVPQSDLLLPHLNVRENILFSAAVRKIPFKDVEEFFNYLIGVLGIDYLLDEKISTLSGGERQKAAIARAMLLKPRILLLDESLSSLDRPIKTKIIKALGDIHRDTGVTFLHVTHDQDEAFILGNVISLMFNGKIEQTSRKNGLYYFPRTMNVAVFTGMDNIFTGFVESVDNENRNVSLRCGRYIFTSKLPEFLTLPEVNRDVYFGIRGEEVMILRQGENIKPLLEHNVINGIISHIIEKTSSHTVFFRDEFDEFALEIELVNLVYRKLNLKTGGSIQVSLKSSSIWISLEDVKKP
ncbi:MAG: ABC transporter [Spirochaetae bacterium HGW-Spirochaetae-5]|nr:MAG: ABC transporter [Spirochaetae bacterium HGW-Spirochaetae-5]